MRLFRRFRRDRRGSIMIEMAMIGPLFILMLAAIIELGITLFTQAVLDGAARDAARLIRIGQVQAAGGTGNQETAFQNQLCSSLSLLSASCGAANSTVYFSVKTFANFGAVSFSACNQNPNQAGNGTPCPFQPGTGGQIVAVRVTYARPYIIPWVGKCLSGGSCWVFGADAHPNQVGTGSANLMSTVVFQNEPFP